LVLGFGVIVVALVIALTYLPDGPAESAIPGAPTVTTVATTDPAAISIAQKLHPLLDDEERFARKYLAVGDPMYARLRRETQRVSRAYLDSLQRRLPGRDERALLTQFRRTHESLAAALDAQPGGNAAFSDRLTDTMDVLHARVDQIIKVHQQARTTTTKTAVAKNTATPPRRYDVALGALLLGLAATAAFAYWMTRGITGPLSQLRRGTERIARGDYRPVHVNGSDEIGRLARAFNAMSARLQHVDKYKADMMQQISHELRTPLQAMHSAYYMLAEQIAGPLNERQRHLVTSIRDNIDAMSTFSNQFLDLAKIEAGVMEYNKQQVDLLSLLTPIINSARLAAAPKEITIGLAAQSVPAVNVDPAKFNTVVSNLLNNAVKFTPKGGNITVSLGPCGTGARVSVKDSGVGIDADDLPKLFTKFFQGKSASAADTKGTGVGLALVKAIVDGHGGKVYATSTIGVGSTFTVELPTPVVRSLPHVPHPN
jgi:signal transduction histidine kinase